MENDNNAAEAAIVAMRKNAAIAAMPVNSSGHEGVVGKRVHQSAIGAASNAAAVKEMASRARGVSIASVGRNLRIRAITIRNRNEIANPVTPYSRDMSKVSPAESGWFRKSMMATRGMIAKRATRRAALAATVASSIQKAREDLPAVKGSCANHRSMACER